nr:MAG TPA: Protein of unknown function (DUF1642) [Caudoviricetes sp.]
MNTQELIEKYEDKLKDIQLKFGANFKTKVYEGIVEDLRQLDEPQKVQVPQFVADWYEEHKDNLEYSIWDWMKYNLEPKKRENVIFSRWLGKTVNNPVETLIKMKLYDYEVEKEKRYIVKFKNVQSGSRYFKYDGVIGKWYFGINQDSNTIRLCHTKEELEEAGFGWVFDCPGMEVEEVE